MWHHFAHLLFHGCKALMESSSGKHAQYDPSDGSPSECSGFKEQMRDISAATGWHLTRVNDTFASFSVNLNGRPYTIALQRTGVKAMVAGFSAFVFPPSGPDPEVIEFMERQNEESGRREGCLFGMTDWEDGQRIYISRKVKLKHLNPRSFLAMAKDTLPRVVALDELILSEGYAP